MIQGGRKAEGSGLGTHVHPWLIHVNVWQNQYSIVKQNKVKKKKLISCTKKNIIIPYYEVFDTFKSKKIFSPIDSNGTKAREAKTEVDCFYKNLPGS